MSAKRTVACVWHGRVLIVGLMLCWLAVAGLPAEAVYRAAPDGAAHPNVAITFTESTNPTGPLAGGLPDIVGGDYCSGVLVAPTLVLVAGNNGDDGCFADPWDAFGYVSFATDYDPPAQTNGQPYTPGTFPSAYPQGKPCQEPCYRGTLVKGSNGLGVLVLDQPAVGITPALLPAAGSLSALQKGLRLTTVGYGDGGGECDTDPCVFPHIRRAADLKVTGLRSTRIKVTASGNAFPCDDAGGANFLTGTPEQQATIVGLTDRYFGCDKQTDLLRLDRGAPRDVLCSVQFADQLGQSPLCGPLPPQRHKHKHHHHHHH